MYKCGICGTEHNSLDEYMECVTTCGAKLKKQEEAEKAQKRMEDINAALNRVKQAKTYYEDQLAQFKEKYPIEYDVNFGTKKEVFPNKSEKVKKENYNPDSVKILYEKKNDEEPKIRAKVNGKDVSTEELLTDPDVKYLTELLGIFG